MALPAVSRNTDDGPLTTLSREREAYASEIAGRVLSLVPEYLRQFEASIDYEVLSERVIAMARDVLGPIADYPLAEYFLAVQTKVLAVIDADSLPASRKLSGEIYRRLFKEIRSILTRPPEQVLKPRTAIPYSTGDFFNSSRFEVWKAGQGGYNFGNIGVFRSGDPGVAATPYASYQRRVFRYQNPHFLTNLAVGVGAFAQLPDENFAERYSVGIIPSARLLMGLQQKPGGGFTFREAAGANVILPVGVRMNADAVMAPLEVGASVRKEFSRSTSVVLGARALFYPFPENVQDISLNINHDATNFFAKLESPVVDLTTGLSFYNNKETLGQVRLSRTFQNVTVSLQGQASLTGDSWASAAHTVLLGLNYEAVKDGAGVIARTHLNLRPAEASNSFLAAGPQYDFASIDKVQSFGKPGDEVTCKRELPYHKDGKEYYLYTCPVDSAKQVKLTCAQTPGTDPKKQLDVTCSYQNGSYKAQYGLTWLDSKGEERHFRISKGLNVVAGKGVVSTMLESKSLADLENRLAQLSEAEQAQVINLWLSLLYKSYNTDGLRFLLGTKSVNQISLEEMFTAGQAYMRDPDSVDTSTVCRGIARFGAHLGHVAGFHAHVVALRTDGDSHVVAFLRKPGGHYKVLNYGDDVFETTAVDLPNAILQFSKARNYPPQIRTVIFDHEGKYERTFITNEGRLLIEATTPQNKFEQFLEFW